ncbi:MAG: ABC transporter ATP-binding protein, partial [Candidatus Hydrogenedentota bacterium]
MKEKRASNLLVIQNVSKRFRGRPVVRDLSLEIPPGSIFGFLGPNGAGKTTTMRMVTGILEPTVGRILVAGFDVVEEPLEAKRRTGFIPDSPFLYPKLTGEEYLELIADLYHLSDWKKHAEELLERFVLSERRKDFIESYSFGMRQKLSICGALLPRPSLIVVDEPLIGLDPPAARTVKDIFLEETERGAAIFMSTHLLEIAEALCDTVGILDNGELVAMGRMEELLSSEDERLEEVFLKLLAERREEGTPERERWEALARAAARTIQRPQLRKKSRE